MHMHSFRRILLLLSFAFSTGIALHAQENCTNGVDDDFDGLVDLNDTTDCVCSTVLGGGNVGSIIPNPSFEEMTCCPQSYSELNCAMDWVQATWASSDYFNTCGFFPSWISAPLPDGQGCVGGYQTEGYQEYFGTCLLQPMLAGESYTFQMNIAAYLADNFSLQTTIPIDFGAVDVIVYGFPSCPSFPINTAICPEPDGWIPLGSVLYDPSEDWQFVTITFTPVNDIYAVMIGAPCDLPQSYGTSIDPDQYFPYFVYDGLDLIDSSHLGETTISGGFCTNDLVLHAHPDSLYTDHQWYQNGVALVGQTDSLLHVSDLSLSEGTYQFRASNDASCAVAAIDVPAAVYPGPYIVLIQDGFYCPEPGEYAWFLNGQPITGAYEETYVPLENGSYTVQLTNDAGCSALSAPYELLNVGVAAFAGQAMQIRYTASSELEILGATPGLIVDVFDMQGRAVQHVQVEGLRWSYDLSFLPSGVYLVCVGGRSLRFVL